MNPIAKTLSYASVRVSRSIPVIIFSALLALWACSCTAQTIVVRQAPELRMLPFTDCNSPAHWVGDTLYVFNSQGGPVRIEGPDVFHLSIDKPVVGKYDNDGKVNGGRWIECAIRTDDGALYGYYHNEVQNLCPTNQLTLPRIGAARSTDNGANWTDLGIILEAPEGTMDCNAKNGYFSGGNGDFSCILDAKGKYVYFFISTYAGDISEQGLCVARMDWSERDKPVGKVSKYYKGSWSEPGLGGHISPVFTAKARWQDEKNDAFWGPSIHWNTHLRRYVMLLNHVQGGPGWPQEGIYASFCRTLDDPRAWSRPKKILNETTPEASWYPEVIGIDAKARETDKLCGKIGRLFMHGFSKYEIIFLKDGEKLD